MPSLTRPLGIHEGELLLKRTFFSDDFPKDKTFSFPLFEVRTKGRSWVLYFLSKRGWGWLILTSSYVIRVMSTLKFLEPPFHSHVVNFILSLELVKVRLSVFENSPEMSHFNFHDKNRQKSCRINLCIHITISLEKFVKIQHSFIKCAKPSQFDILFL